MSSWMLLASIPPIRFWRRHFVALEGGAALAAAAAVVVWLERADHVPEILGLLYGNRGAVYGTLASVFGALLGFVITTLSVVLSTASHERLAPLKRSKHYGTLWLVFTKATWALGVATALPVVALLADRDSSPARWVSYAVLWATLLAILRVVRVVWVLEKIIAVVTGSADEA